MLDELRTIPVSKFTMQSQIKKTEPQLSTFIKLKIKNEAEIGETLEIAF